MVKSKFRCQVAGDEAAGLAQFKGGWATEQNGVLLRPHAKFWYLLTTLGDAQFDSFAYFPLYFKGESG
jgi:hypothetical protein